ncbi:MAG: TetR/AcrR family transcriptional regulator [Planctomycetota bacterium]
MASKQAKKTKPRKPLSRDAVLAAAMKLADAGGIEKLSMRKLGQKLGVEAMSLYNHVANKDEVLDGIVDIVYSEIEMPKKGAKWKPAMRRRAGSAREVLKRHPWALGVMESRTNPGMASMNYYEAIIRCLREAGFSIKLAGHAFSVIDSYLYGFALQELKMPFDTSSELADLAAEIMSQLPVEQFPYFCEFVTGHVLKPGYDYANEFKYGLELILDGLELALGNQ